MTQDAGRELDALVAEKVMGWPHGHPQPEFSTDIAAAWEVVEKLNAQGYDFLLVKNGLFPALPWRCRLAPPGEPGDAEAKTAPLAICRAAIRAVGHKP